MEHYGESSASDLISRLVNAIGARDELGMVPFVQAWPRIAGQDCAAHSQVMDVRNGTVLVGVDHPAWLQQLHLGQTRILKQIQRDFPSLSARYLHFTIVEKLDTVWSGSVDESAEASGAPAETRSPPPVAAREQASGANSSEESADPDSDEEFRRHLEGLRQALEERDRDHSRDVDTR